MKTRKAATDEAFLNEAQTLLALPPAERNIALDMLQRLRASLELLDFMGFADEGSPRLSPTQAAIQDGVGALVSKGSANDEAQKALDAMTNLLVGPDKQLAPAVLVEMVGDLATSARAGFKSGGNGKPWSAALNEATFTPRAFQEAEDQIGSSLKGLADNAALAGIEVEINCRPDSDGPPGSFVLSGGIRRSERVKAKLTAYERAQTAKREMEAL